MKHHFDTTAPFDATGVSTATDHDGGLFPEILPALLWASALAHGWLPRVVTPSLVPAAGHALAVGGWIVTTTIADDVQPPRFGRYGHCDPRRRCVGCEAVCSTEAPLQELHHATGLTPLVLTVGGSLDSPTWVRAGLWLPTSPYLSGLWTPAYASAVQGLGLVDPDRQEVIVPIAAGEADVRHVRDGVVQFGRSEQVLLHALPKMWELLQDSAHTAPADVLSVRGLN